MADELETQGEGDLDLSDPANWSGNSIEQSLAALDAAGGDDEPEEKPKPELPAPPDPNELETLRRERDALREGLQVRTRMEAERASTPAPAPTPAPEAPLTEAQVRQMYDEDPVRASALMASRIVDARAQNLDTRMATMLRASAAIVESQVSARHTDAFAKYGDEIRDVVRQFSPENQIDPNAWDTAVQLVRGRHMDDEIAARVAAELEKRGAEARAAQAKTSGFSGTGRAAGARGGTVTPTADQHFGLSAEQRKVADTMGVTYKEYAKYV